MEKGTGYFSNDHLCIALCHDTEFKKTKKAPVAWLAGPMPL